MIRNAWDKFHPTEKQASFFPLLAAEDDTNSRANHPSHRRSGPVHYTINSNFNVPVAGPNAGSTVTPSTVAMTTAASKGRALRINQDQPHSSATPSFASKRSSIFHPRSFVSQPAHRRERNVGQPLRAQPISPPTSGDVSSRGHAPSFSPADTPRQRADTVTGAVRCEGGGRSHPSGVAFDQKPVAPRSHEAMTENTTKLIGGSSDPTHSTFTNRDSGHKFGSRVGGHISKNKTSTHSPPKGQSHVTASGGTLRSSRATTFNASNAWSSCGSADAIAPRHGGGGSERRHSGDLLATNDREKHRCEVVTLGGDVRKPLGELDGRHHHHSTLRSAHQESLHHADETSSSNRNENSPSRAAHGERGQNGREARGVVLPGPEGGVIVRELAEGILIVCRSRDEKKRSPERLNLHRRQLTSCPFIQVRRRIASIRCISLRT